MVCRCTCDCLRSVAHAKAEHKSQWNVWRYVPRGGVESLSFEDALAGLATDGELLPAEWPKLDTATLADFAGAPYGEVARHMLQPFMGDDVTRLGEIMTPLCRF